MQTAIQFGIVEGTVHLYIHRTTIAILDLQQEYICWPEPHSEEFTEVVERHQLKYGFQVEQPEVLQDLNDRLAAAGVFLRDLLQLQVVNQPALLEQRQQWN